MATASISASGPCCENARVTVHQIEVLKAKMDVDASAMPRLWNWDRMTQKKITPAAAPMRLARNCSALRGMPLGNPRAHAGGSSGGGEPAGSASSEVPMG